MFFSSAFAALPPRSKLILFALTAPITNSYCVATLFWYFLAQYVNKNCPFHLSAVIVHISPNSYSSNYNATFSFLQKAVNRYWPIIYNYHMQDFASMFMKSMHSTKLCIFGHSRQTWVHDNIFLKPSTAYCECYCPRWDRLAITQDWFLQVNGYQTDPISTIRCGHHSQKSSQHNKTIWQSQPTLCKPIMVNSHRKWHTAGMHLNFNINEKARH